MERIPKLWERLLGRAQETPQSQWKIIALCILGATTFWFFSALNKQDYNSTINYPIHFEYTPKDSLVVVEELPSTIRMNVTGGGWNLFRRSIGIGIKPLSIQLNSPTETRYVLGSSLVSEINDQVKLFSLNQVVTDTLHLHIEQLVTRLVPLGVDARSIILADNHVLVGPIQIDPLQVEVRGHASYVNSLPDTFKLSLEQENIDDNYDQDITLPRENPAIVWSSARVAVSFPVDPLVERTTQAMVLTRNFPDKARLVEEVVPVSYKIASSRVDSVGELAIIADYRTLKADSTITLTIEKDHAHIYDIQPQVGALKVTHE